MSKQELSFDDFFHSDEPQGWSFATSAVPEMWRYRDQLVIPGGKVLDLGIGPGGASIFFALQGMEVFGLDINQEDVGQLNEFAQRKNLSISAQLGDVRTANLGQELYDVVILEALFVHFTDKKDVLKVLEKALAACKPGGHIWVRTPGKEDEDYKFGVEKAKYSPKTRVNEDVYLRDCSCSEQWRPEPHFYLGQTDLLQFFLLKGAKIVHSQTMPDRRGMNVMFGEDWPNSNGRKNGMVSILVQKR